VNRDLLSHSAEKFGVLLSEEQLDACALLTSELQRWNKRINLTAIQISDEITIKHLIDSLRLVPLLARGIRLLDVGSGGGFPALPLAIARPDLIITSIDSVSKKISFHRHIIRQLRLDSCEALHGRVEDLAKKKPKEYDLVTSRAFSTLSLFLKLAWPLVHDSGKVIAMRGPDKEHEREAYAETLKIAGFELEDVVRYSLPKNMGQRCLIVATKSLFIQDFKTALQ
jgi:16S rRNA (guanine527-N7)-methyltransferase